MPFGIAWLMWSRRLNWQYYTEPQEYLDGRRLFWPRGKTLGGSSASNAMCYTRGHPCDYDDWERLGNPGWSHETMLPYFRRAEHHEAGGTPWHGVGGPLNVAPLRSPNPLSLAFVEAGVQAGFPRNNDFSGPRQEGVGLYEVTQKDGRRHSAAHAFLHPAMNRPNLSVITGAQATGVILENGRATGVRYLRDGVAEELRCEAEVVLCGGAVNTPQLLMLSGIGAPETLTPHGIPVRHELPGVGRNLQDHLDSLVVHKATRAISYGLSPRTVLRAPRELYRYFRHGRGMFTSNAAEAGGFVRSTGDESVPDLQFHFTAVKLDAHGRNLSDSFLGHGFALHVCNLRPHSRGFIGLHSADPTAPPLIQPCYLSDARDMEKHVAAVKIARRVLAMPAFDEYRGQEIRPGKDAVSDEAIRAFVRRKAETIYHPVGTCRMGRDADAVVDARLRVRGLEGLRVVDASIMPTLVGGNTNAPVIAIAEKASDMIREDRAGAGAEAESRAAETAADGAAIGGY
jgi:choline dehydrogenase-like flavoprotein